MEAKMKISITDINSDGTLSVLAQTHIIYNGQENLINNHREAISPGQFDRAKVILPENQYNAVVSLWTSEIIAAWKERQEQLSEQLM